MRLQVIKNSIQLCLRTLVFSIVLRHSNYNNRIISIEGTFFGGDTLYKNTMSSITVTVHKLMPGFHFARIVPKRTGEHAQIEKRFINPAYFRVYSRIKIKSSSQVNFLAYYGSMNQSTFTKF